MRLIGLDPGLRLTGWGVIEVDGNRLRHVAHGVVRVATTGTLAERLRELFDGVAAIVEAQRPIEAAVEETFVNINPGSTLKLGQAHGEVLLAPARAGLPVFEYAANLGKKSVVGAGHADKRQIALTVGALLPGGDATRRAPDALAVGHRVGLSSLSTLSPDEIARAIAAGDKASLSRPAGVGPKLAARLATELKDKAAAFGVAPAPSRATAAASPAAPGSINEDAVS